MQQSGQHFTIRNPHITYCIEMLKERTENRMSSKTLCEQDNATGNLVTIDKLIMRCKPKIFYQGSYVVIYNP